MAKVLDSLTLPIKKNGVVSNETIVNNPLSTAGQFSASTAYAVGQYVYYDKKLYRFTTAHAAGAWNASHVTEVTVTSELASLKAETNDLKQDFDQFPNGNYPNMTAGNADQLVSTVTSDDDTPYNFRTTAGSADVGDRAYVDAIVGGTLNVNQLVQNGNFADGTSHWQSIRGSQSASNSELTYTVTVEDSSVVGGNCYIYSLKSCIAGHKYFHSCDVFIPSTNAQLNRVRTGVRGAVTSAVNTVNAWTRSASLSAPSANNNIFIAVSGSATSVNDVFKLRNVMVIDLTQKFGSTIADYIYGLEQANAGAGVAWLKANAPKIFNGEYIPFNAGTLQSVVGLSEKRNTGLNQWDEEWEVGSINGTTGANEADGTRIRSKNYIPVFPSTSYFIKTTGKQLGLRFYDADKNILDTQVVTDQTWVMASNCHYLRFIVLNTTTYDNDICINLHWDGEKDGTYEPYTLHTYAFDPTVELRGVPKLKDGKMYFDGDRYLPDGQVQHRYGITDLGTLEWIKNAGDTNIYYAQLLSAPNTRDIPTLTNAPYTQIPQAQTSTDMIYKVVIGGAGSAVMYFRNDSCATVEDFVSTVNGKYLVYLLATPTTETATPYNPVEIVDDFGTEEFITTSPVPVGHETRYAPNLRAKLEMAPESPDGDGLYIVQQSSGENTYIPLASSATIQDILDRLTALENA